ncbi:imelysin family protein [Winogradskyella haliclonae]|uniref:Iron-regulated protein A n=1 Tax=Winogradskyella haliclonae TaxID=2048558 RepID=A0ABQ2C0F0_9FLAO|nr:imelysin family protein [Winogradskyella haliclonae]GGI57243.1 iron-regulated protein A precursor [Winogradskyella haliclonae]
MIKRIIFGLILCVAIAACSSSDDGNNGNNGDGFNRTELLTNLADNIIIPAFQDLGVKLSAMDVARANFVNSQTQTNLDALSAAWLEAYSVWQHVELFNIGEAEDVNTTSDDRGFVRFFNIYPVSETEIDGYAASGTYDLTSVLVDQGFPAFDYLIHGIATGDATALDKFTTHTNASGYMTYMTDVMSRMLSLNNQILNDWQNTYKDQFISATENGLNGSFNKIANDFIFAYEKGFRAQKVGTPAGVFSAGQTFPDRVEAFYKGDVSKTLALESLTALENFFVGRAYNGSTTGSSLRTYLQFLDSDDIVTAIQSQFTAVRTSINGLGNNFSNEIENNNTQVLTTYEVMQAMVPLIKVDMRQALDFAIDFQDSDGD